MNEFTVQEIREGWILSGPENPTEHIIGGPEKDLYLPTIHAVADILVTWQVQGFAKAAARAEEKYGGK